VFNTDTNNDIWLGKTITGTYWDWDISANGSDQASESGDYAAALSVDSSGNAYVLGQVQNLDTGSDIWLGKASNGAWEWAVTKTGTANNSLDAQVAWAHDASNNIYILGQVVDISSEGRTNIWFAKYNASGTLVYEAQKDGPVHLHDNSVNFALDKSGNAYVFGTLITRDRGRDIWLGKYGPTSGVPLWEINKSGSEDDAIFDLIPLQSGWRLGEEVESAD
jgi:hypothetical protein